MPTVTHLPSGPPVMSPRIHSPLHEQHHTTIRWLLLAVAIVALSWTSWSFAGRSGDEAMRALRHEFGPRLTALDRDAVRLRSEIQERQTRFHIDQETLLHLEQRTARARTMLVEVESELTTLSRARTELEERITSAEAEAAQLREAIVEERAHLAGLRAQISEHARQRDRLRPRAPRRQAGPRDHADPLSPLGAAGRR